MEGFITEPNDIYLWNIVTYSAHRRHCLLFIICKYRSIFLCVTTGSVALLVYKPFVYFIISLSNKVLLFNSSPPPATRVAFHEFIEIAKLGNIKLFLETAASTSDGENLKTLWACAFKEGLRVGHELYVGAVESLNMAHNEGYE